MNSKTLKALKGSIAKWTAIVAGTGTDEGQSNCALCQRFDEGWGSGRCTEDDGEICPVARATGYTNCQKTPYQLWDKLVRNKVVRTATTAKQRAAAQAELDFLKSILPEGER